MLAGKNIKSNVKATERVRRDTGVDIGERTDGRAETPTNKLVARNERSDARTDIGKGERTEQEIRAT